MEDIGIRMENTENDYMDIVNKFIELHQKNKLSREDVERYMENVDDNLREEFVGNLEVGLGCLIDELPEKENVD